jgi:copper oxidase (laccase) domain-containing protein
MDNTQNIAGFRVILSVRADGNMSSAHGEAGEAEARRGAFCGSHGIDHSKVAFIEACHTGSVALVGRLTTVPFLRAPIIDADFPAYLTAFDGLLSLDQDIPIALLSGDCVPLVVADEVTGLHGILHVGLLGLLNDITGTCAQVLGSLSIPADRVNFHLGPHISADSYDLSKSGMWKRVGEQALERCPWVGEFISHRDGGDFLDLARALESRLAHIGALPSRISVDGRDTAGQSGAFFSHFRAVQEGIQNGRFMTLVGR